MSSGAMRPVDMGDPSPNNGSPILLGMIRDIRTRLAPICAELPPARFTELVLEIARVQFKYDQAAHVHL